MCPLSERFSFSAARLMAACKSSGILKTNRITFSMTLLYHHIDIIRIWCHNDTMENNSTQEEIWKTIVYKGVTYEGYMVSSHGNFKRLSGVSKRRKNEYQTKGLVETRGALMVSIRVRGGKVQAYAHRLVMAAFNYTKAEDVEVYHIDGDLQNNRIENLTYAMPKRNHPPQPFEPRFFAKVQRNEESGCLIWTGSKMQNGYGVTCLDRKKTLAHIASYTYFVGPVPAGHQVHHKCMNRSCVNWEHLEPLTPKEHNRWHELNK